MKLQRTLNKVLSNSKLYSEEAFPTAKRRKKLEPLIEMERDARSTEENQELNRKLMQLAFPLALRDNSGERLYFGFAGIKIGSPLPFTRRAAREVVEPLALTLIIKFGMGVITIFVALIVTSPIIPDTFARALCTFCSANQSRVFSCIYPSFWEAPRLSP